MNSLLRILPLLLLAACAAPQPDISGVYRGTLQSPGGILAFPLHITKTNDGYTGFVINGADTSKFTSVSVKSIQGQYFVTLDFSHYDAQLEAEVLADGTLSGNWNKRATKGQRSFMEFKAEKNPSYVRYEKGEVPPSVLLGEWSASFTDDDGVSPASGIFSYANGTLYGTFLTETGDYRFLEGYFENSSFVLSTFDGAHAFLFTGNLNEDGMLSGGFWSRETYFASWTAKQGASSLQDPWSIAKVKKGTPLAFSFPDLDGTIVSNTDPEYAGKPILLYLFGSWCPNCADEAKMLKELYPEFAITDLQIIGLAFEYSGEFESDAEMVKRYKNRFAIPWRSLIAGISDKKEAAKTLSFMDEVTAFPTAIFADRNHKIQAVHVGFRGPSTGSYYFTEKELFRTKLVELTR